MPPVLSKCSDSPPPPSPSLPLPPSTPRRSSRSGKGNQYGKVLDTIGIKRSSPEAAQDDGGDKSGVKRRVPGAAPELFEDVEVEPTDPGDECVCAPSVSRAGSSQSRGLDLFPLRSSLQLPESGLPSNGDLVRYARYLREKSGKGNNYTNYDIAKDIAPELCDIWSSAAAQFKFPVILGLDSIANKIKKLLVKAAKTTNRLDGRTSEIQKIHDESTNLFDIIKCRYVYSLCCCLLLALFCLVYCLETALIQALDNELHIIASLNWLESCSCCMIRRNWFQYQ